MPDNLSVTAYAKINLSLDITGTRPDGYHTLSTVMQSIDLHDTLSVEKFIVNDDEPRIVLEINDDELPTDSSNTAFKAAQEFFNYTEIKEYGVKIKIRKNIPVKAGLGGGSSDAAAVIYAMNKLFCTALELEEMIDIATEVGMDVPFCLKGGTQLAEGVGAILTPLPDIDGYTFLIVKADEKGSTAEMYKKFDELNEVEHPYTAEIVNLICEGEVIKAASFYDNVFAPLWGESFKKIKRALKDGGAINAILTGSGPSIVGIFADEDDARRCKAMIDDTYDEVYLCSPVDCGIEER